MRPSVPCRALIALAAALCAAAAGGVPPSLLRGRVSDRDGLPLPGVAVTLIAIAPRAGATPISTVTDSDGRFAIESPGGDYRLTAELSGFQPAERAVTLAPGTAVELELRLDVAAYQEQVTVRADAPRAVLGETVPDAPVTVTREVVDSGMLPNSQYDDVLPLLPNVVRGPDGLIAVAGAAAPQGGLLVNGFNLADPISGEAVLMLPLEAIDSVEVFSGGYDADAGRATGGVTSVHTRSGGDQWHASANSFFPRIRFVEGRPSGVDYWEPNVGVSGPLWGGRLLVAEAVSYRFDRDRFKTLAGSQDSVSRSLMSWSQIDWRASGRQQVSASVSFDPQHTDHGDVTAFTSVDSTPELRRGGWSVGLVERLTVGHDSAIELRAASIGGRMSLGPNGAGTYQLAHDRITGGYFDARDLRGARTEGAFAWSWTAPRGHQVKAGASVSRESLDGTESAGPEEMFDSAGRLRRRITFGSPAPISVAATHAGVFVQDRWTISPRVSIDAGARYDSSSRWRSAASPRLAWTVKLPWGDSTVAGSAGLFADKIPLLAYAFPEGQDRLVESWDAEGAVTSSQPFLNTVVGPGGMPAAARWDTEFARRFADGWQARVKYQERRGRHELVVEPVAEPGGPGSLVLESSGVSMARSLEVTAAFRAPSGRYQWYVSYVRAEARGPANSLAAIQGPFREAFVQPDEFAPLPADVPNRALAWGLVHLPSRITVAPFLEVRSGFPFAAIDDTWKYAAPVNSARLPWFGSLDLYVNKIFSVSHHLPDARLGLKLYNIASAHTERDVQRDVERADFGHTYNPIPRDFSLVFELLWGHQ